MAYKASDWVAKSLLKTGNEVNTQILGCRYPPRRHSSRAVNWARFEIQRGTSFKLACYVEVPPSVGVGTYLAFTVCLSAQNQVAPWSASRWCDRAAEAGGL